MSIFGVHPPDWDIAQIGDRFSYLSYSKIKCLMDGEWDFVSRYIMQRGGKGGKSASMRKGELLHKALLQPALYMEKFVIAPKFEGEGSKKARATWLAGLAKDAEIVEETEVIALQLMLSAIRLHPNAHKILSNGTAEQKVVVKIEGVTVLIIPDMVHNTGVFTDLKTCQSVDPDKFGKDCWNFRYHIQGALYQDGLNQALGTRHDHVVIVAVQNGLPFKVQPFLMEQQDLGLGRTQYLPILRRYGERADLYRKAFADCEQYRKSMADAGDDAMAVATIDFEMERDMRARFLSAADNDIRPLRFPTWAYNQVAFKEGDL